MLSKKILQALPELGLLVREQVFQKNLIVYCPGSLNVSCNAGELVGVTDPLKTVFESSPL